MTPHVYSRLIVILEGVVTLLTGERTDPLSHVRLQVEFFGSGVITLVTRESLARVGSMLHLHMRLQIRFNASLKDTVITRKDRLPLMVLHVLLQIPLAVTCVPAV